MTSAADERGDDVARDALPNEPPVASGEGASATNDAVPMTMSSGPPLPATALRGRANVYEKYLNHKLPVDEGPTAFGKRLHAAASGVEISNSNDEVELEAGEVVSDDACAVDVDDADGRGSENQENEPMNRLTEVVVPLACEKPGVVHVATASPTMSARAPSPSSPSSPTVAAPADEIDETEKLMGTASCSPSAVDTPAPIVPSTEPDDEPMPCTDAVVPDEKPIESNPVPSTNDAPVPADQSIRAPDVPVSPVPDAAPPVDDPTPSTSVISTDSISTVTVADPDAPPVSNTITIDLTTDSSDSTIDVPSSPPPKPRSPIRIGPAQYNQMRREGQLRRDVPENRYDNHNRPDWQSPPRDGPRDRRENGPSPFRGDDHRHGGGGPGPRPGSRPRRGRSRSRSSGRPRDEPPMNGPGNDHFRNGRPPSPNRFGDNGGFRGPNHGDDPPFDGRGRSPPRNNFGPPNGPPRGRSPQRDFRGRLRSPMRGGPGPNGGPPFGRDGPGPNGGPPFGRDGPGPMNRGPNGGRRSRSRSPPRGPGGPGRSPPRNGPPVGPGRNFRGSPGRNGGGQFSPRFAPRDGPPGGPGRPGSPRGNMMGPPRSPHRGGRPISPGRFGPGGPPRSPPRDGFRGPPPNMRPRSPGFRGGPPPNMGPGSPGFRDGPPPNMRPRSPGFRGPGDQFGPRRDSFGGGFDNRGPPRRQNEFNHGPPHPFAPRGRSRSRSPLRKRDRSWERQGSPPMDGMMHNRSNMLPPMHGGHNGAMSPWIFEVKRSGRVKFRCIATPETLPFSSQLPLSLDIVQLPHLDRFQEFLMLDRGQLRRIVYEMRPESMGDKSGYDELKNYLLSGREGARAGLALDLERVGYKVFVLPPGAAARALGYKGDLMIAIIRRRN